MSRSMRRGFTLLELLVATAVFIIGFIAAYAMFLTGVHNRSLADAITRSSLASTSLLAEMRMTAGREKAQPNNSAPVPAPPSFYGGDGFAHNGKEALDEGLIRYPDQPGVWYRVIGGLDPQTGAVIGDPHDLSGPGGDDPHTVAVKLCLFILHCPVQTPSLGGDLDRLTWQELDRRYRVGDADGAVIMRELARRKIAQVYDAVIHRQASWLP